MTWGAVCGVTCGTTWGTGCCGAECEECGALDALAKPPDEADAEA
jgi:hypothetical protein